MLAEVYVTGQLAADQNVKAVPDDLGLDRAGVGQRLVHLRRAQIDEQAERRTQAEQRLFRTLFARHLVPLGTADRTKQHGIRVFADFDGLIGQRDAVCVDRAAARKHLLIMEGVAELLADFIEHLHGLGHDLRADAVALDDCDIVFHRAYSPLSLSDFNRPPALMMLWMNGGNAAA